MLRLDPDAHRAVERPDAMEDQLRTITPQFFLRHTHRVQRLGDPDWLDFEHLEAHTSPVQDRAPPRLERFAGLQESASLENARQVALRRSLVVETRWPERFGLPDPVEPA